MSDVKQLTTRGHVSWVNADTWPDAGGCNVLCLTDRQVSIIRQMVWPRALADNVLLVPVWPGVYNAPDAALTEAFTAEVDSLLDKLGTEGAMDCTDIVAALEGIQANTERLTPWVQTYSNTSLAAGTSVNTAYTVPSSGIGVRIDQVTIMHVGTATSIRTHLTRDSAYHILSVTVAPVSQTYYTIAGPWYLQADDVIQMRVAGATAGDDITCFFVGVSWAIAGAE